MHLLVVSIVLIISGTVAEIKTETVQTEPLQSEVEVQEEPPSPAKRLTWRDNPNDCDLSKQWVREDNLECLDKVPEPQASIPSGAPTGGGGIDCTNQITAKAFIYCHESGNDPTATNGGGCRGLGQACPGSKLPCSDTDYACQDAWFTNYMKERYGTWEAAKAHWLARVPINGRDVGNWW